MAYWAPMPEGQLCKKCDLSDMKDEHGLFKMWIEAGEHHGSGVDESFSPSLASRVVQMIGAS